MNYQEFKLKMSSLPKPATDKQPPYWEYWRLNLWEMAQAHEHFWEYPCVYHTMLVQHWLEPIVYEWKQLDRKRFSECTHLQAALGLSESDFRGLFHIQPLTNNLIHQAYHIQRWEEFTGRQIQYLDTIVEFGGGYGAMCLLCHNLGFKGRYITYDLPEFGLLQEYHLSQYDLSAEWNPRRKPKGVDLFIALYSISEVNPLERKQYIPMANSFLFLYSGKWQDYDNVGWFRRFASETVLEWTHKEIGHLPDAGNLYSIGY